MDILQTQLSNNATHTSTVRSIKHQLTTFTTSSVDWLSSRILDNPYMFNYVRYLLAGNQTGMKTFIGTHLNKYQCRSIADICCGTGDFAALTPADGRYNGWDINDDFIIYARNRYKGHSQKSFSKLDVLHPPNTFNKRFDAVMLISTLHHFSDNDLAVLLPFVSRISNKLVIVADIIPDPPHLVQKFFARIDRGKFVRPASEKLRQLERYFKVVHTEPIPTRSAVQFGIVCQKK